MKSDRTDIQLALICIVVGIVLFFISWGAWNFMIKTMPPIKVEIVGGCLGK